MPENHRTESQWCDSCANRWRADDGARANGTNAWRQGVPCSVDANAFHLFPIRRRSALWNLYHLHKGRVQDPRDARAYADLIVASNRYGNTFLRNIGARPHWGEEPRGCFPDHRSSGTGSAMLDRLLGAR